MLIIIIQLMDNPRATVIMNNTKEQQQLERIIEEMFQLDHISLSMLLIKVNEAPGLKVEPELIANIFENRISLVKEMIQWALMPRHIMKHQKAKFKPQFMSYNSKQFMRNNWCFYENLYLAIRQEKLSLDLFFRFLKSQYYNEDTVPTALGYFSEIMVPFARYEFSGSYYLSKSVQLKKDSEQSQGLMKILTQDQIDSILQYCHNWAIYEFLTTAVLVSLEDPKDFEASNQTIKKLFQYCQVLGLFQTIYKSPQDYESISKWSSRLQNVATTLSQLAENIEPKLAPTSRVITIINSFLNSNLIMYSVNELKASKWCHHDKKSHHQDQDWKSSSVKIQRASTKLEQNTGMFNSTDYSKQANLNNSFFVNEVNDEDTAQILLKILKLSLEIFIRLPKDKLDEENSQLPHKADNGLYIDILDTFRSQIQDILTALPILNQLVYNKKIHPKQIPFSSGQDIRPVSFMKYQYFDLLYHCLVILQQKDIKALEEKQQQTESFISTHSQKDNNPVSSPDNAKFKIKKSFSILVQPFSLDIENLHIIQIIEKYLSENRWNNIAHHLLQKICHVLIMTKYEYIKQNIAKDHNNKLTNSFLAYLIQNFTQKHHIFLDTMKFTSQGNLHSLYNIAKFLAYSLNSSNQLMILLNDFAPWKKFLMEDLKKYQEQTFPIITQPKVEQLAEMNRRSSQLYEEIKVDEVDSIRKLVQNISVSKKWPMKGKITSKSAIFRKSFNQENYASDYMYKSHGEGNRKASKFVEESDNSLNSVLLKKGKSSLHQHELESEDDIEQKVMKSQVVQSQKRRSNMHNSDILSSSK